MKKIIQWIVIVLVGLFVLMAITGLALYPIGMNKLSQTYPNIAVETVSISTNEEAVSRGRHVATIWSYTMSWGRFKRYTDHKRSDYREPSH